MKSFSDSVIEYKKQLDKGDIQIAYRGLLDDSYETITDRTNAYIKSKIPFSV
jgi:hypothetical protein